MLGRMIERRRSRLQRERIDPSLPRVDEAEALFADGLASWHARRGQRGFPKRLEDPDEFAYRQASAEIVQRFDNAGWRGSGRQLGYRTFAEYDAVVEAGRDGDVAGDDGYPLAERVTADDQPWDEDHVPYEFWDPDASTIREQDRWQEYAQRIDREQGRASRMMDDALRTTVFEEHLQAVLDPDDFETWRLRREVSLKALAAIRGVSVTAVFYREEQVVQRARVEWKAVNPDVPIPPILLRRPRHDSRQAARNLNSERLYLGNRGTSFRSRQSVQRPEPDRG